MTDHVGDPMVWDSARIDERGGALIAAASGAGIGVSFVSFVPPAPRVVYISDKGVEILGHSREVILSRPAGDFVAPDRRSAHDIGAENVRNDERPRLLETVIIRADGVRVPIEVAVTPIRLDGQPGFIAFTRDITMRRNVVTTLEQSEHRFRQLIELAPDAVWINDGLHLRFANPAAARMLGYDTVEELLDVDPRELMGPTDRLAMRERTLHMFKTGESLPPRDYTTRRRDGSWVLTEVQSMPISWEGTQAILGFARDVTARKELEARLSQTERLAALGTLLAGIAHEMNNPLSYTLLGIEQAIAMLEGTSATPEQLAKLRESLESAHHGATRVAAVIGQIRASSRPDAEDKGPVELRRVLESALRVTQNEIHHRAKLVTDLGDVPPIIGSPQRLEQVFLNLLVNAVQALPDGRAENEIRVVLRASAAAEVIVEVADNGPGIAETVRARIFDPFFTTKPVGLGQGLGLSICHGIVSAHGGSITVDSIPGRGSIFRVVLPAPTGGAATAQPGQAPTSAPGGAAAKRRRVLVIDDEPALAAMIRRVLQRECHVDVAGDAREALALLGQAPVYDVILCDLMMPDMTGMDLYGEVARRYPGVEEQFVFMTGGAFTSRAVEFLAEVKNRRLEKPFETAVLKAVVAAQR